MSKSKSGKRNKSTPRFTSGQTKRRTPGRKVTHKAKGAM